MTGGGEMEGTEIYGRRACQLVKELASAEPGQLTSFNVRLDYTSMNWDFLCGWLSFRIFDGFFEGFCLKAISMSWLVPFALLFTIYWILFLACSMNELTLCAMEFYVKWKVRLVWELNASSDVNLKCIENLELLLISNWKSICAVCSVYSHQPRIVESSKIWGFENILQHCILVHRAFCLYSDIMWSF